MSIFFKRRKIPPLGPIILKGLLLTIVLSIISSVSFAIWIWFSTDPTRLMPPVGTPSELDGQGRATVMPDVIPAGGEVKAYTLTFTVGSDGLEEGSRIHIVYPSEIMGYGNDFRTFVPIFATDSLKWFMDADMEVKTDADVGLEISRPSIIHKLHLAIGYYKSQWGHGAPTYSLREMERELVKHTITVTRGAIPANSEIKIVISSKKPIKAPRFANWTSFAISVDGNGDGISAPIISSPRIITTGRKATAFRVVATSSPKTWEKIKVIVCAIDDDGQVDPSYTGTVYLDAPAVALPSRTEFKPSDLGRKEFHIRSPREGVYFIVARDSRDRRGRSNPIVVEEKGDHLYWGDPHLHSIAGIGGNLPEWVLRNVRDDMGLDFASLTLFNHKVPFDSHLKFPGIGQPSFTWDQARGLAKSFNKPGKFAVISAFEWGNNQLGHRNIYYSPEDSDIQLLAHTADEADTVKKIYDSLKGHKAIAVPHHSAWRGGRFMAKKFDWGPKNDHIQRLVEVYSSQGSSEYYNNPFPIHAQNPIEDYRGPQDQASKRSGAFVKDALANGYKLGLIAGGDLWFGLDHPASYPGGLTAVWAKKLTATDIWNSMYSRRCYGTTGARIYVKWTVGESGPGNEIAVEVPVTISINVVGTAPIKEVRIIKFEGEYDIAKIFKSSTEVLKTEWQDFDPPKNGFYYLRVTQEDGHMAWSGPIWVYRR